MLSASPNGGSVGGPSGSPVMAAKPLIASASVPNPARSRYGPVCPKPEIRTSTSPGLISVRASNPSPHRSNVPGRKLSTTMSAVATSRRKMSAPSGSPR